MQGFVYLVNLLKRYLKLPIRSEKFNGSDNKEPNHKPYWLILRCSKCNNKSIPMVSKDKVLPVTRFCKHCGSEKFYIERRYTIEHLDTIYAIHSKDLYNLRQVMVRYSNAQIDKNTSLSASLRYNDQFWEDSEQALPQEQGNCVKFYAQN